MYTLARTAFKSKNYEQAVNYYEQLMTPSDWEANFYFYVCYAHITCNDNNLDGAIHLANKAIETAYDILEKEQDLDKLQSNTNTTNNELEILLNKLENPQNPKLIEIKKRLEQRKSKIFEIYAQKRFEEI
jgi:uncharacterized protein (DUF342 family)